MNQKDIENQATKLTLSAIQLAFKLTGGESLDLLYTLKSMTEKALWAVHFEISQKQIAELRKDSN